MRKYFLKTIVYSFILVCGVFYVGPKEAQAECSINSAQFRAVGAEGQSIQVSQQYWYRDDNKPYVYIDFQTTGCTGQEIELSLTEWDDSEDGGEYVSIIPGLASAPTSNLENTGTLLNNDGSWNDDDVNGSVPITIPDGYYESLVAMFTSGGSMVTESILNGVYCSASLPSCIDNRPIVVPENNFTVALETGEDECEQTGAPDCIYYIRVNDEPFGSTISSVSTLRYNCHGMACDEDWTFLSEESIPYQGVHSADPALSGNQEISGTGGTLGTTEYEIDIQNPIGENSMTLVDFIKKVIKFALTIGIPIVAIAIIYSGLLFVTARGNDSQLETAKNAFTYAVIGGAILLGSWIFSKIISDTINSIAVVINYFG